MLFIIDKAKQKNVQIFGIPVFSFVFLNSSLNSRGLGTPTTNQHNILDSEKLSQFFFSCTPDGVRTSWSLDLEESSALPPTEPPRH